MEKLIENPHPGVILKEEFLQEIGMSKNKLTDKIGVPSTSIHAIIKGTRKISVDADLRLSKSLGLSEGYWLHLQNAYDILEVKRKHKSIVQGIRPYKYEESVS